MILKARLSALLNTVKSLMNEKKFDDSLSFYRRINSIYSNLKLESKEEFFDEVESYNFNIGVYFKLKEAMALFEENQDIELPDIEIDIEAPIVKTVHARLQKLEQIRLGVELKEQEHSDE